MDEINYKILELIKYEQKITDLLEFAFAEYEYDKNNVEEVYSKLYFDYKNGFLNDIIRKVFKNNFRIKSTYRNLFSFFLNKKKFEKLLEIKEIKYKVSYLKSIMDSFYFIDSCIELFLHKQENEILDATLVTLIEETKKLHFAFLCFANLNILSLSSSFTSYKDEEINYRDKDVRDALKMLIHCKNANINDKELKSIFEESFELFINKQENPNIEANFIELYNKCSKKCISLEIHKVKLFNEFTQKAMKDLEK